MIEWLNSSMMDWRNLQTSQIISEFELSVNALVPREKIIYIEKHASVEF